MNISKATFIKLYNLVYHDNQGENEYKLYIQTGLEFFWRPVQSNHSSI